MRSFIIDGVGWNLWLVEGGGFKVTTKGLDKYEHQWLNSISIIRYDLFGFIIFCITVWRGLLNQLKTLYNIVLTEQCIKNLINIHKTILKSYESVLQLVFSNPTWASHYFLFVCVLWCMFVKTVGQGSTLGDDYSPGRKDTVATMPNVYGDAKTLQFPTSFAVQYGILLRRMFMQRFRNSVNMICYFSLLWSGPLYCLSSLFSI